MSLEAHICGAHELTVLGQKVYHYVSSRLSGTEQHQTTGLWITQITVPYEGGAFCGLCWH